MTLEVRRGKWWYRFQHRGREYRRPTVLRAPVFFILRVALALCAGLTLGIALLEGPGKFCLGVILYGALLGIATEPPWFSRLAAHLTRAIRSNPSKEPYDWLR